MDEAQGVLSTGHEKCVRGMRFHFDIGESLLIGIVLQETT